MGLLLCPEWGALLRRGLWDPGVRRLVRSSWTEVPARVLSVSVRGLGEVWHQNATSDPLGVGVGRAALQSIS